MTGWVGVKSRLSRSNAQRVAATQTAATPGRVHRSHHHKTAASVVTPSEIEEQAS